MAETPKNLVGKELHHGESAAKGIDDVLAMPAETSEENSIKIVITTKDAPESSAVYEQSNKVAAVVSGNDDPVVPREIVPPTNERARSTEGGELNLGETWGKARAMSRRKTMEDFVCVKPGFITGSCDAIGECISLPNNHVHHTPNANYFGVFDGHGGSEVQ